jgi:diguanylate cyclase (GGDEF)-like protein
VAAIGVRLRERRADVERRSEELNRAGSLQLAPAPHASIQRVTAVATDAVAQWLSGHGELAARRTGDEAATIFSQLAIQRDAPLDEITKRILRWRDATSAVLDDIAEELHAGREARRQVHRMLRRSADVALVRLCEAFERERSQVDDELARRERELVFQTTHDALTGLPNRTLIIDRAAQLVAAARRERQLCAALFIDLDGFKAVNDGLGHRAGDDLLRSVAARLESTIREADTLGRLGGDEFVILAGGAELAAGPELVAERLLHSLRQPFAIDAAPGGRVTLTASIGIAIADGHSAEDLLRDADIAMYRAKLSGANRYLVFESDMQDVASTRVELELELRDAVADGQLHIVYQPLFTLESLTPIRVEALLRWERRGGVPVSPEVFVPLLEQRGLISQVGRWVLAEACACCADWARGGLQIGVAVNVSAVQLERDEFVADVADALQASGIEPAMLTIEITETALMRDSERTAERLRAIKALGVRLSIDDFGTGYSSLAYLQRFPVDELKIDRSFISQLAGSGQGGALIRTFVELGRALDIETTAEGIEDEAQLSRLRAERCDIGQGYLFARPMPADRCQEFLERAAALTPPERSRASAAR